MVVWNSMLLKIIILPSGVVKQHVRFISYFLFNIPILQIHFPVLPVFFPWFQKHT